MHLTKYILPLVLLACVPIAADDTGALKVGDGEPSSEEPSGEPSNVSKCGVGIFFRET